MAVPQYITRLRAMTEDQRHQMFATADTPFRRLVVAEYLAREVEGDEAFDKRMSGFNEELERKSFKTSVLNVLTRARLCRFQSVSGERIKRSKGIEL